MRSIYSEATCEEIPSLTGCFEELNNVVLLIPFKKLLSSTRLKSAGIMFRYSSSVTTVESITLSVSII